MKKLLSRIRAYTRQAWKLSRDKSAPASFLELMGLMPRWLRSLDSTPLADKIPWINYSAIEFLDLHLQQEMKVFEWGVGGSTVFFASRVGEILSVEHDVEWSQLVRDAMDKIKHPSWQMLVAPPVARENELAPDPADPRTYAAAVDPYTGSSFRSYASAIDRYPDEFFDVVLVDGRSRLACAMHAIPKVKPGGYLMLDDSDRPRYAWAHQEMQRLHWTPFHFPGPRPCLLEFHQTSAWRKNSPN